MLLNGEMVLGKVDGMYMVRGRAPCVVRAVSATIGDSGRVAIASLGLAWRAIAGEH